jgi:hypothetical protein
LSLEFDDASLHRRGVVPADLGERKAATMIRGSCLCGGIQFEVESVVGAFELCHCSRCRKSSGSAFMAAVGVRAAGFRYLSGRELVRRFELPVRAEPPPYSRVFCERCGCIVPEPDPQSDVFEIAAGLLDDDPGMRPERHIMVECKAPWTVIGDGLPQFDLASLLRLRAGSG